MKTEITCEKCGSDRVENFTKEKPEVQAITMKDYIDSEPGQVRVTTLEMRYTRMVLLCKDCGNRYEYTI